MPTTAKFKIIDSRRGLDLYNSLEYEAEDAEGALESYLDGLDCGDGTHPDGEDIIVVNSYGGRHTFAVSTSWSATFDYERQP